MPPSNLGLMENIGAAMSAYAYDSFPSSASRWLAAPLCAAQRAAVRRHGCSALSGRVHPYRQNKRSADLLSSPSSTPFLGTAMVVAARTRYQWGEFISVRISPSMTPS
jgi:hypothetical protein